MENADPRRRHSPTGHIDKGGETTIERRAVLRAIGIALRVQGRNYDQVTEQNRGAYCHHLVIETFCRQNAALFSCQIEFSPSLTMPQNFGARFILRPVALFFGR